MTYEDQLGGLATKIAQAKAEFESAIKHAQDVLHRRVDGLVQNVGDDTAELYQRFREMEDGVVRHRDQTLQALQGEMNRLRTVEDAIAKLPALVQMEVAKAWAMAQAKPAEAEAQAVMDTRNEDGGAR